MKMSGNRCTACSSPTQKEGRCPFCEKEGIIKIKYNMDDTTEIIYEDS